MSRSGNSAHKEHSRFWVNYLKNQFEAKWRKRNHTKAGDMKFLEYWLFHPYNQFTRYYYYMSKLTGNNAYLVEAKRRAGVIEKHFRPVKTSKGIAYEWAHSIKTPNSGCAPSPYVDFAVMAMKDLNQARIAIESHYAKGCPEYVSAVCPR